MSRMRPAWMSSSASRPVFIIVAPIGLPPRMRLMMTGLAPVPEPASALSTQVWPVSSSNTRANSATAAASPADVHQWVTSRLAAEAAVVLMRAAANDAATAKFFIGTILPRVFQDGPPALFSSKPYRGSSTHGPPQNGDVIDYSAGKRRLAIDCIIVRSFCNRCQDRIRRKSHRCEVRPVTNMKTARIPVECGL